MAVKLPRRDGPTPEKNGSILREEHDRAASLRSLAHEYGSRRRKVMDVRGRSKKIMDPRTSFLLMSEATSTLWKPWGHLGGAVTCGSLSRAHHGLLQFLPCDRQHGARPVDRMSGKSFDQKVRDRTCANVIVRDQSCLDL